MGVRGPVREMVWVRAEVRMSVREMVCSSYSAVLAVR